MGGWLPCGTHTDKPATFGCSACNVYACGDCVRHNWVKDHFEDQCPRCQQPMQPIGGGDTGHARGPAALIDQLPALFGFLKQPSLLMLLVGLTLLTAPLSWAVQYSIHPIFSILGLVLLLGFELSIYFRIVLQTAYGEDEVSPPEFSDIWTDLVAPTIRFLAALLPIIAGALWYAEQAFSNLLGGLVLFQIEPLPITNFPGPAMVVLAGLILLPLLTIVAALSSSALGVLHPGAALNNLRLLGSTYWVGALVFYGILLFEKLILVTALWWLYAKMDIPVVGRCLAIFIGYLPFALRARWLGLMVRPYVHDG